MRPGIGLPRAPPLAPSPPVLSLPFLPPLAPCPSLLTSTLTGCPKTLAATGAGGRYRADGWSRQKVERGGGQNEGGARLPDLHRRHHRCDCADCANPLPYDYSPPKPPLATLALFFALALAPALALTQPSGADTSSLDPHLTLTQSFQAVRAPCHLTTPVASPRLPCGPPPRPPSPPASPSCRRGRRARDGRCRQGHPARLGRPHPRAH